MTTLEELRAIGDQHERALAKLAIGEPLTEEGVISAGNKLAETVVGLVASFGRLSDIVGGRPIVLQIENVQITAQLTSDGGIAYSQEVDCEKPPLKEEHIFTGYITSRRLKGLRFSVSELVGTPPGSWRFSPDNPDTASGRTYDWSSYGTHKPIALTPVEEEDALTDVAGIIAGAEQTLRLLWGAARDAWLNPEIAQELRERDEMPEEVSARQLVASDSPA